MRLAAVLFLYRWTDVVEVTAHYSACCDWAACVCALLSSASWQVSFPFLLEQATADWSLSMLGICFVFCQVLILIGCYMWAWQTKCLYDLIRLRLINMWLKNNCLRIILTSSCQGWSTLNTYVGFLRILARLEGSFEKLPCDMDQLLLPLVPGCLLDECSLIQMTHMSLIWSISSWCCLRKNLIPSNHH
jgi:hypothetical protein